ncbi:hypothetical protein ACNKHV_22755 [Shigella flexneri]
MLQQMVYKPAARHYAGESQQLADEPQVDTSTPPKNTVPDTPRNPFRGVKLQTEKPIEPVYVNRFFEV